MLPYSPKCPEGVFCAVCREGSPKFARGPPLGDNTTSSVADVVPESAPAAKAQSQAEALSEPVEAPAILVYSNPEGFTETDLETMIAGVRRLNEGPGRPYRLQRAVPLSVKDPSDPTRVDRRLLGRQTLPVLLYFERGTRLTEIATGVREIREDLQSPGPLQTGVTGIRLVQYDTKAAIEENLELVTAATAFAILLIVALTYRSLVAPLIPLTSIGLATFLTLRILGWIASEWELSVPSQIEPIIVVLLFVEAFIVKLLQTLPRTLAVDHLCVAERWMVRYRTTQHGLWAETPRSVSCDTEM